MEVMSVRTHRNLPTNALELHLHGSAEDCYAGRCPRQRFLYHLAPLHSLRLAVRRSVLQHEWCRSRLRDLTGSDQYWNVQVTWRNQVAVAQALLVGFLAVAKWDQQILSSKSDYKAVQIWQNQLFQCPGNWPTEYKNLRNVYAWKHY